MRFRCPRCGNTALAVEVTTEALLRQEGGQISLELMSDTVDQDMAFSARSIMRCPSCNLKREAGSFLLFNMTGA